MSVAPCCPFVDASPLVSAHFDVLVEADGRVLDVQLSRPSGLEAENVVLDGALMQALRRLHFRPADEGGRPRRGWGTIECVLRLSGPGVSHGARGPLRRVHG
ncbi:MAG: hypothetical protein ACJ8IK_12265 [Burkholderiaceae bacterium]